MSCKKGNIMSHKKHKNEPQMKLTGDLYNRLENTDLPKAKYLLPIYEAISNSIHSTEEAGVYKEDKPITIEITRTYKNTFAKDTKDGITKFTITDYGVGFTDDNFNAFRTLDTANKRDKGGKGIGRIYWLKVFNNVEIQSIYCGADNKPSKRSFKFNASKDIYDIKKEELLCDKPLYTQISLCDIYNAYSDLKNITAESLANSILEHFFYYFAQPDNKINIKIIDDQKEIILGLLLKEITLEKTLEKTTFENTNYNLIHFKLHKEEETKQNKHGICLCAHNRLVKNQILDKQISGLQTPLEEAGKDFIYRCYVYSEYFDKQINSSRSEFKLEKEYEKEETKSKFNRIISHIIGLCSNKLQTILDKNISQDTDYILDYIDQDAPQYRPLKSKLTNIPHTRNKRDIRKYLRDLKGDISEELEVETENINIKINESIKEYKKRLEHTLDNYKTINQSDLADYLLHRKIIINILEQYMTRTNEEDFALEAEVHNLLMPMRTTSDKVLYEDLNLWLLDERLVFHKYLGSDKSLKDTPITDSHSLDRPDMLSINQYSLAKAFSLETIKHNSISIVELKRPGRTDYNPTNDPIRQCINYVQNLRDGKIALDNGRYIIDGKNLPAYCYIITDIGGRFESFADTTHPYLHKSPDGMGMFGVHGKLNIYIEIISYDALLLRAKENHNAFFKNFGMNI